MSKPKNIIMIMTDQQSAHVRNLEGYSLDTTPFLDSLAAQGTWFNKAYTTMPVCGPARTSLLTGRWPSSHCVNNNNVLNSAKYEKDLFDVAREQGYKTALIGKHHCYMEPAQKADFYKRLGHWGGFGPERTDQEMAYDKWLKTLSEASLEPAPFPLECQIPYRAVSAAEAWVREMKDCPFFMWLSFPEPHSPYQVPEPYYSMFPVETLPPLEALEEDRVRKGDKWRFYGEMTEHYLPDYRERIPRVRSNYLGMLRLIDDQIRRFVEFLDDLMLLDNTVIVFMSDHGDFVGEYELIKKGPEAPEILSRIPLQFFGPGIKADSAPHPAHVSLADVMPTLCEVMGVSIPSGVQGRSLWPLLSGEAYPEQEFASVFIEHGYGGLYQIGQEPPDYSPFCSIKDGVIKFDELNKYSQSGWQRSVCKGEWKMNMDMLGNGQLYRISEDRMELTNLYGRKEYADVERQLLECLCMWLIRTQVPTLPSHEKYPVKTHPRNYLLGENIKI
jgi:arylsulfatase A-like enzyme